MRWDKHSTITKAAEQYYGKGALLETWEKMATPEEQHREHAYLLELRAKVRVARQRVVYATRNTSMREEKRRKLDELQETD